MAGLLAMEGGGRSHTNRAMREREARPESESVETRRVEAQWCLRVMSSCVPSSNDNHWISMVSRSPATRLELTAIGYQVHIALLCSCNIYYFVIIL